MKKIVASVFTLIQIILTIVFLYHLNKLLPLKYLLAAAAVLSLFVLLSLFLTFCKKTKTAVFPISILLIILLSVGTYYVRLPLNMLENNTNDDPNGSQYNKEYVSIVVMQDAKIETIADLDGQAVGIDNSFEADKMNFAWDWIAQNYAYDYKVTKYDQIELMLDDLYSGKVAALVLDSARYPIFDDIKEDFINETREIVQLNIDYSALYALTPTPLPTNTPTPLPEGMELPTGEITERPFIVYISGIDTYGSIASRSRSDTNVLMAIDPVKKKILLVSTPRDTYTPLYNKSNGVYDKLTHAGLYGPECSMGTLAALYNTQIDYYVRINFTSVIDIVDAIGGIDVNSARSFHTNHLGGYSFNSGINHLDGKATLAFCRERYAFADGDFQRGRNHLEVIKGLINRVTSPSILTNYVSLMNSLNGSFQTNMTTDEITSLIKMQLNDAATWNFESLTLQNTGARSTTCYSMPGPSLYVGKVVESSRQAIEDELANFMYRQ